jgi:hypothetical protein
MARRFGSAMISNTDSTLFIYSTEHIRVKVYTFDIGMVGIPPRICERVGTSRYLSLLSFCDSVSRGSYLNKRQKTTKFEYDRDIIWLAF